MYDTGNPKPVLCDNLDGWGRVGGGGMEEGTHECLWPIHIHVWQTPSQYLKVIVLQLKKLIRKQNTPPHSERRQGS